MRTTAKTKPTTETAIRRIIGISNAYGKRAEREMKSSDCRKQ